MANEVTFTLEALQQVIAQALPEALKVREAEASANKLVDGKTDASLKMDILVVKAFKRAGFGEV